MTQEDIIRMAREAGDVEVDRRGRETFSYDSYGLERFFRLAYEAGVAAEREACAKVCDGIGDSNKWSDAHDCAAAIRARSKE